MLRITLALRSITTSPPTLRLAAASASAVVPVPETPKLPNWCDANVCTPSALADSGASVSLLIKQPEVTALAAVRWMQTYALRQVRHEGVMYAAAWKAFKVTLPLTLSGADAILETLQNVSAVARAFRIVAEQQLVNDHQLLVVGVGKCIECAPVMGPRHIADTMVGLRYLGRQSLTVAQAEHYRSRLQSPTVLEEPMLDNTAETASELAGKEVELLDVLSDALEQRIMEQSALFGVDEIIACIASMAAIGVSRSLAVHALGVAAQQLEMTNAQIVEFLTSAMDLHSRVVDALDYEDSDELRDLCMPLFLAVAKRLGSGGGEGVRVAQLAKTNPTIIIALRKLCERNASITDAVPTLWDQIRGIRVAHRHLREASQTAGVPRFTGRIGALPQAKRVKVHDSELRERKDRFVPPAFKGWRGNKVQQRHLLVAKKPQVQRFGALRIRKGYIKGVERKHSKSHY